MPGIILDEASVVRSIRNLAMTPPPHPRSTTSAAPSFAHSIVANTIPDSTRFVLIGEASHGTDEFYRMRADITKVLIEERGFNAVAVEGDFPDCFRANLWVRNFSSSTAHDHHDTTPDDALSSFIRFPEWMWRNHAVKNFLQWLRRHNDTVQGISGAAANKVGFYGIDVYSLHTSAAKVVEYLKQAEPELANAVKRRYECFYRYGEGAQDYARAVGLFDAPDCANEAIAALKQVLENAARRAHTMDGELGWEEQFAAEMNSSVVADAEKYYRNMFYGDELTWNLRDTHFLHSVSRLHDHLTHRLARAASTTTTTTTTTKPEAKIVVWAHNSHLGDASATDMGQLRGEINLGQLMRERYGMETVFNIGFTTDHGHVAAADSWDTPGQRKAVRPGMPGSYEALLHRVGLPIFALALRPLREREQEEHAELLKALNGPMLERAIGVIYRPQTERQSHYFYASLPRQFDLVIHVDKTKAVRPLEPAHPSWEEEHLAKEDLMETYPFGV